MNTVVKVLLRCVIRFLVPFRWYAFPDFCLQISHPLVYGVRTSSKASATADLLIWWRICASCGRYSARYWLVTGRKLQASDLYFPLHIPRAFQNIPTITLSHLLPWLVKHCGKAQSECRHQCMKLVCQLAPLLPGKLLQLTLSSSSQYSSPWATFYYGFQWYVALGELGLNHRRRRHGDEPCFGPSSWSAKYLWNSG